jgi:hypothetical protein
MTGMRLRYSLVFVAFVLMFCVDLAHGVDSYGTEQTPADAFEAIPPNLRSVLDPVGTRLISVSKGRKTAICDVWWRKQIPTAKKSDDDDEDKKDKDKKGEDKKGKDKKNKDKKEKKGAYDGLQNGVLVGVVSYLVPREDFEHHALRPAVYTMRYSEIEEDEDESEETSSPYRDFVILSPVWAEKDANEIVPRAELEKRGRMISHHDEPAMLSLVPVNPAYKKFPTAVSDDRGFCALQVLTKQAKGRKTKDVPLAILLIRPLNENEGS